jgi:hypothetical protein
MDFESIFDMISHKKCTLNFLKNKTYLEHMALLGLDNFHLKIKD